MNLIIPQLSFSSINHFLILLLLLNVLYSSSYFSLDSDFEDGMIQPPGRNDKFDVT